MVSSPIVDGGIVLGLIVLIIYFLLKDKYKYFERRGIPYSKHKYLVVNIWKSLSLMNNLLEVTVGMYKDFPNAKVVGFFQGFTPTYFIRDPEIVHKVLVKEFSHFQNRGFHIDEETNPLEGHLFNLSGTKWKTLRNKLSPTFTAGKLKGMLPLMDECIDSFICFLDLQVDQEIEMKDALTRLTIDVIGSCAFGIDSGAIRNPDCEFRVIGKNLFRPPLLVIAKIIMRLLFPRFAKKIKLKTIPDDINDFFFNITKQNFQHRLETGTKRNDFMQLLLQLREKGEVDIDPVDLREKEDSFLSQIDHQVEDNGKLTFNDGLLTAQAFVFFLAGFETAAASLSFIVYHLSKNQEIQEKLRREIRTVKNKHGSFSYEALKEMKYLKACIDEGLRMNPPNHGLFRKCNKSLHLEDGIVLEKGYQVFIPAMAIQKDPAHFPDPETYNPDRFTARDLLPGTFLPFGDGPRICIAQRFALLELKLTIARLVDRYRIETCPMMKKYEPLQYNGKAFFLTPKDGIFCKLRKISD